jgi:hypothetical protein
LTGSRRIVITVFEKRNGTFVRRASQRQTVNKDGAYSMLLAGNTDGVCKAEVRAAGRAETSRTARADAGPYEFPDKTVLPPTITFRC